MENEVGITIKDVEKTAVFDTENMYKSEKIITIIVKTTIIGFIGIIVIYFTYNAFSTP